MGSCIWGYSWRVVVSISWDSSADLSTASRRWSTTTPSTGCPSRGRSMSAWGCLCVSSCCSWHHSWDIWHQLLCGMDETMTVAMICRDPRTTSPTAWLPTANIQLFVHVSTPTPPPSAQQHFLLQSLGGSVEIDGCQRSAKMMPCHPKKGLELQHFAMVAVVTSTWNIPVINVIRWGLENPLHISKAIIRTNPVKSYKRLNTQFGNSLNSTFKLFV